VSFQKIAVKPLREIQTQDADIERLGEIAAEAYAVAGRFCGSCRNLHALWPYIRLSRSSTGLERSGSVLETALRAFVGQGLRKILIAGAADTGLLSLVLRAADDVDVDVTVLDVCASPLELCRRLAGQWSIPVRTVKQDLADLDERQEFDLVLVHGTLHFIAGEKRLNVLARIHRGLRPNGRLVLLFNTSRPSTIRKHDKLHVDYAESVVNELRRLAIPLPDSESEFIRRLSDHSRQRQEREGAFANPGDAEQLLETAGFEIIGCSEVETTHSAQMFTAHISKHRFMAIAEPKFST
jgi:SAM-dependent methyltransferase